MLKKCAILAVGNFDVMYSPDIARAQLILTLNLISNYENIQTNMASCTLSVENDLQNRKSSSIVPLN